MPCRRSATTGVLAALSSYTRRPDHRLATTAFSIFLLLRDRFADVAIAGPMMRNPTIFDRCAVHHARPANIPVNPSLALVAHAALPVVTARHVVWQGHVILSRSRSNQAPSDSSHQASSSGASFVTAYSGNLTRHFWSGLSPRPTPVSRHTSAGIAFDFSACCCVWRHQSGTDARAVNLTSTA